MIFHRHCRIEIHVTSLQDLPTLAAVIKERITNAPFLVVFDNVWDGGLFRRDCLNVLPEEIPGALPTALIALEIHVSHA